MAWVRKEAIFDESERKELEIWCTREQGGWGVQFDNPRCRANKGNRSRGGRLLPGPWRLHLKVSGNGCRTRPMNGFLIPFPSGGT